MWYYTGQTKDVNARRLKPKAGYFAYSRSILYIRSNRPTSEILSSKSIIIFLSSSFTVLSPCPFDYGKIIIPSGVNINTHL